MPAVAHKIVFVTRKKIRCILIPLPFRIMFMFTMVFLTVSIEMPNAFFT